MELIFFIIYLMSTPNMLHIMQQESYQNDGMYRWILKNPKKAFKNGLVGMIVTVAVMLITSVVMLGIVKSNIINEISSGDTMTSNSTSLAWTSSVPMNISFLALMIYSLIIFFKTHKERKEAKKPLKYTARVKRLIFYNLLVVSILLIIFLQTFGVDGVYYSVYHPIIYSFLIFTIPVNMIISNWFA